MKLNKILYIYLVISVLCVDVAHAQGCQGAPGNGYVYCRCDDPENDCCWAIGYGENIGPWTGPIVNAGCYNINTGLFCGYVSFMLIQPTCNVSWGYCPTDPDCDICTYPLSTTHYVQLSSCPSGCSHSFGYPGQGTTMDRNCP